MNYLPMGPGKAEAFYRRFRFWISVVVFIASMPGVYAADCRERYERVAVHMGTQFALRFYADSGEIANRAATAAFAQIKELDDRLSDYNRESELSRLGRTSGRGEWVPVSGDLWRILVHSREISQRSDGAFDITAGPYVRLWRHARRSGKMPSQARLDRAKEVVGYRFIHFDLDRQAIELTRPNMRLDAGGIAKGFAADAALAVLRRHGISAALVDAGGDLALGDPPPGTAGWKIGIAPLEPNTIPEQFLVLARCGVATSGDAFQHVVIDGVRYSHIVDPRTGYGVTTPCSVTVIGPDATTADSLASAICVLGPDSGIALADRTEGVAARIVYQVDDTVHAAESAAFGRTQGKWMIKEK